MQVMYETMFFIQSTSDGSRQMLKNFKIRDREAMVWCGLSRLCL